MTKAGLEPCGGVSLAIRQLRASTGVGVCRLVANDSAQQKCARTPTWLAQMNEQRERERQPGERLARPLRFLTID